jgi:uncharacterized repeat protein (TIGR01451 family)
LPQAYASAVLADGRAVVVGGEYSNGSFVLSNAGTIYDPKSNTWTSLTPPSGWPYIGDVPGSVLANGQFLIGNKLDTRLALLNPATLTWTLINPIGKSNGSSAEEGWTLLPDGSLLTVDVKGAPNSERFIPSIATWVTAGNTPVDLHAPPGEGPITVAPGVVYTPPGEMGPALRRPDGTVFAEGGNGRTAIYTPPPANSTAPGSWIRGPDIPSGTIEDGPAALLPSGHVLAVTSPGGSNPGLAFFEFDGSNLNPAPAPSNASADPTTWTSMLLLPTGQVMLSDGSNIMQIYTSAGTSDPSWAPSIGSVPGVLMNGSTYAISGTQFNGLSQASAFGDESQNATNYPLVRITNNASGHVFYARTHGHSSMGVATGSAQVSTSFDVPANNELGASVLAVVANGIPSVPVPVSITSTLPPPVTLTCPANIAQVGVLYISALIASGGQPPFTYSIATGSLGSLVLTPSTGTITGTPSAPGVFSFTAKMADSFGPPAGSTTANCSITISGPGTATFVRVDNATQGSWKGVYGAEGFSIAGDSTNLPPYALLATDGIPYTWVSSTTDPRALLKAGATTDRIAATWYSNSFTVDLNIVDSNTHQLALYCLDWDSTVRRQKVDILDGNGNVLNSQSLTGSFNRGEYLVWNVSGHVQIRVTLTGGDNAVVSGVFLGPASNPGNPALSISKTHSGNFTQGQQNATYTVTVSNATSAAPTSGTVTVTETAPGGLMLVSMSGTGWSCGSATCTRNDALTGGSTYAPIAVTVNVAANATSPQVNQVDVLGGGSATANASDSTIVNPSGSSSSSASFVKLDTATQGNWRGVYGSEGYTVVGDLASNPAYVTPVPAGQSQYVWASSTGDIRALQQASNPSNRIAGTWYSNSFTVDLNIADSNTHQLALYCLDWDSTARRQKVDILDGNGNVLDSQNLTSSFNGGVYLVWNVSGHVKIRVTLAGGDNAVLSGLFFH